MSNKKRYLALALAVMFIAGMAAPVAAEEKLVSLPANFEEIKSAFPDADIVNYEIEAVSGLPSNSLVLNVELDAYKQTENPVNVYTKNIENGTATLYVYADGSYMLFGFEEISEIPVNNAQIRGFDIISGTSLITGKASCTGSMGEYIRFYTQYYSDQNVFCKKPYDITYRGSGTTSYQTPVSSGYSNSNRTVYVSVTTYVVVYDAWGAATMVENGPATLKAHRNGAGGTPYVTY